MPRLKQPKMPRMPMREHHSVTVRKISNGFIVETRHERGNDYGPSVETYHPKKPNIKLTAPPTGTAKSMAGKFRKFIGE